MTFFALEGFEGRLLLKWVAPRDRTSTQRLFSRTPEDQTRMSHGRQFFGTIMHGKLPPIK